MGGGYSKNVKKRGEGSYGDVYEFRGGVIKFVCEDPKDEAYLFEKATGQPTKCFLNTSRISELTGAIIFPEAYHATLYDVKTSRPNFCRIKKRALFIDLLKELKKIHSRGVLHGDIHLGNIMAKDPKVSQLKLVDFGQGRDDFTLDPDKIESFQKRDVENLGRAFAFWTRPSDMEKIEQEFWRLYTEGVEDLPKERRLSLRSHKRKRD